MHLYSGAAEEAEAARVAAAEALEMEKQVGRMENGSKTSRKALEEKKQERDASQV